MKPRRRVWLCDVKEIGNSCRLPPRRILVPKIPSFADSEPPHPSPHRKLAGLPPPGEFFCFSHDAFERSRAAGLVPAVLEREVESTRGHGCGKGRSAAPVDSRTTGTRPSTAKTLSPKRRCSARAVKGHTEAAAKADRDFGRKAATHERTDSA